VRPNFIIVGAQKSATTWLTRGLQQHPEIYLASEEVHFFNLEQNYRRGFDWYESRFEEGTGRKAVGEKTPNYMWITDQIHRSKLLGDSRCCFW
jgi:hypothetical protein